MKKKVGITIIIGFDIEHAFDGPSQTVNVTVVPTHVSPSIIPFKPISCDGVPVTISDGCNMTFLDDCLAKSYKDDMIAGMTFRWDGQDTIIVTEAIDVPILGKQTFEWLEHRM